jgi:hypothetical protein
VSSAGQILPIQPASLGGLLVWVASELAFLGAVTLFTAPAWLTWLVEQFRPQLASRRDRERSQTL